MWDFDDSYESKHVERQLMRHEGLHMKWSHLLKLAKSKTSIQMNLMNDSTPSVTRWIEMVKIARKDFEVLSKGEG